MVFGRASGLLLDYPKTFTVACGLLNYINIQMFSFFWVKGCLRFRIKALILCHHLPSLGSIYKVIVVRLSTRLVQDQGKFYFLLGVYFVSRITHYKTGIFTN